MIYVEGFQVHAGGIIITFPKELSFCLFRFGTSQRPGIESGEGIPGPATYKIPPMFADVPKYLMNNKA